MPSSTGEPRARKLAVLACGFAAGITVALTATLSVAASAVEVDLGAIDTLPPAKGAPAGSPVELTPPAAIRAEIARREAARRIAEKRAAKMRTAEERKRAEIARKEEARRRTEEESKKAAAARRVEETRKREEAARKEADQRRLAADEKARKAAEARAQAAVKPKDLRKPAPTVGAQPANKSERVAPSVVSKPAVSKPAVGTPAPQAAAKPPAAGKARIAFAKGSAQLTAAARKNLSPLVQSLSRNAKSRLVIYAYASGDKARRLSLSRALAVRLHLIKAGIQGTRAEVRALGGSTTEKPLDRVDLVLVGK